MSIYELSLLLCCFVGISGLMGTLLGLYITNKIGLLHDKKETTTKVTGKDKKKRSGRPRGSHKRKTQHTRKSNADTV